jgi:hypothetical protein
MAVDEPKSQYAGMTVNERLVIAGLIDDWDAARARGDREAKRRIAAKVDLYMDEEGMLWTDPGMGKET